jgi:hypothetical protein
LNPPGSSGLEAASLGRKDARIKGLGLLWRAAAIARLIGIAKLNGVDPDAYPRFVPTRIADPINRINELTPWVVGAQFGSAA